MFNIEKKKKGKIIIYPDDTSIMAGSKEELLILRDTLIFVLHNLGIVINFKSVRPMPCVGISETGN